MQLAASCDLKLPLAADDSRQKRFPEGELSEFDQVFAPLWANVSDQEGEHETLEPDWGDTGRGTRSTVDFPLISAH